MKLCPMEQADIQVDRQGYQIETLADWKFFNNRDQLTGYDWRRDKWRVRHELQKRREQERRRRLLELKRRLR